MANSELDFFESKVRPLLSKHCYECHGQTRVKSGLRLDARAFILEGGDTGPAAVPGKPDESLLIQVLRKPTPKGIRQMPDERDALDDTDVAILKQWIASGMAWPDEPLPTDPTEESKEHWAFLPVANPAIPNTTGRTDIDKFINARLDTAKLPPAPQADRRTLLRRLAFVLTGLPPDIADYEAFEQDTRPDSIAFAAQVDRLLASPHYGERWGRHWLDLARYSDTIGYLVGGANREYPYAYTYRDWVVNALNADIPYDRFLSLQVAADRMTKPNEDGYRPDLAALGFLTVGRGFLNNKLDIIDDRIDVVTRTALGLTVSCARCHDHPFDPVSQADYYGLFGVFASSRKPDPLPTIAPRSDAPQAQAYFEELQKRAQKVHDFVKERVPDYKPADDLTYFQDAGVKKKLGRKDRNTFNDLVKQVRKHEAGSKHAQPRAMVLFDGRAHNTYIHLRGSPHRRGPTAPRRFLERLKPEKPPYPGDSSGRYELAADLVHPDNPLTARVMVNRVWAQHFGRPLVDTPSDFGLRSDPPSHPHLLDHLASTFMQNDWSLKDLHRQILLSETWQRASEPSDEARLSDPENRLLSHQNRRRKEFEAMRDSLLAASGQLKRKLGGPAEKMASLPYTKRRTLYGYIDRQNLPQLFRTFDFASPDIHYPKRPQTTTPQQALFMMNSPFMLEQARAAATRATGNAEAQAHTLTRDILKRRPTREELEDFVAFLGTPKARSAWSYGTGRMHDGHSLFTPFPHFEHDAHSYRGGPKFPDPKLDWASLNKLGGHPSDKIGVIRRWTAPKNMHVRIESSIKIPNDKSDGVRVRAISSVHGNLKTAVVPHGDPLPFNLGERWVEAGEHIDFLVTKHKTIGYDTFHWAPKITARDGQTWFAEHDFKPPQSDKAAQLAQLLMCSNEFLFVD